MDEDRCGNTAVEHALIVASFFIDECGYRIPLAAFNLTGSLDNWPIWHIPVDRRVRRSLDKGSPCEVEPIHLHEPCSRLPQHPGFALSGSQG